MSKLHGKADIDHSSGRKAIARAAEVEPYTPQDEQHFPYSIQRTTSKNLPIYQHSKRGGNLHLTTLRKIDGNLQVLKEEIQQALKIEPFVVDRKGRKKELISINQTTRHIVLKGWRKLELERFATERGF